MKSITTDSSAMILRNQVQLVAYPDRLGNNLADLHEFLEAHCKGRIGGIHVLPPYPSNADGGFSPLTHKEIDPRYGSWEDVERISSEYDLSLDLMINHLSDESEEFKDFLKLGYRSEYAALFVPVDQMGDISPARSEERRLGKECVRTCR